MRSVAIGKPKRIFATTVVLIAAVLLAIGMCMVFVSARADDAEVPADVTAVYDKGNGDQSGFYVKTRNELQKSAAERNMAIPYGDGLFTVTLGSGSVSNFEPVDYCAADGWDLKTTAIKNELWFASSYVRVYDSYRDAIVRITLQEGFNAKVSLAAKDNFAYDWTEGLVTVYAEHNGVLQAVARKQYINAEHGGGTDLSFDGAYAHLTGGDSLYIVYGGYAQYQGCVPDITVSQKDYDATAENPVAAPAAKEEIQFVDLIRKHMPSDRKPVVLQNIEAHLVAGDVQKNVANPFPAIVGGWNDDKTNFDENVTLVEKKVADDNAIQYKIEAGNARSSATVFPILKVTAKNDVVFTYDFTLSTTWAYNSVVRVFVENAEGLRIPYKTYRMVNVPDVSPDITVMKESVHMQAGDKLYIEFSGGQTLGLKWGSDKISDTTEGYDQTLRPAYDEIGALNKSYVAADHTAKQIEEIEKIIADTVAAMGDADDVDALIAEAETKIAAVKRGKDYKNIITEIMATADHEKAANSLVEYAAGYGTLADCKKFPVVDGDKLATIIVPNDWDPCCYMSSGQMRANNKVGADILCLTAKEDAELLLDFTFRTEWAFNSIISVYAARGDVVLPLSEQRFPASGDGNRFVYVKTSVHAEAGDKIYIMMSVAADSNETLTISVENSSVTEGTFDATKVLPYEKANAILALVDRDDYTTKQWAAVQETMLFYIDRLGAAEDDAAATAIVEEAKTKIGNMTAIYATADVDAYTALQWDIIENYLAEQVKRLDQAGADADAIVADTTARIADIDRVFACANRKDYNATQWAEVEKIFAAKVKALSEGGAINEVVTATQTEIAVISGGADYAEILSSVRENAGFGAVEYGKATFGLYASDSVLGNQLIPMTDKKEKTVYYTKSDKTPANIVIEADCPVAFESKQMITHGMYAVIALTAKEDMSVTVTTTQIKIDWIFGGDHIGRVDYFLKTEDTVYRVHSVDWVSDGTGNYGYVASLKEGETLYFTVYDVWATVDLVPTFTFGAYDADWTYDVIHGTEEKFDYPSMVSKAATTGGKAFKGDLVNWQFLYGEDLDSLTAFDRAELGASEADNALWVGDRSEPACFVVRWQWRVSNPYIVVLKFTANVNCYVNPTHPLISLDYVPQAYMKTVVENQEGTRITRKTYVPKVNNQVGAYFMAEHLQAGDTMYIVLEPIERSGGSYAHTLGMTADSGPTEFAITTADYDASLRADYAAEERLIAYRAEKAQEVRDYVAAMDLSVYSVANRMLIQEYAQSIAGTLDKLDSAEKVDQTVASVKASIDAVPTKEQEAAELAAYKLEKKAELAAYAKQEEYSAENWAAVQEYIAAGNEAIDAAKTKQSVDTAVKAAQNRIDRVEKGSKKGCGCGSLAGAGGGIVLAVLLLGSATALCLRKKKV